MQFSRSAEHHSLETFICPTSILFAMSLCTWIPDEVLLWSARFLMYMLYVTLAKFSQAMLVLLFCFNILFSSELVRFYHSRQIDLMNTTIFVKIEVISISTNKHELIMEFHWQKILNNIEGFQIKMVSAFYKFEKSDGVLIKKKINKRRRRSEI